MKIYQLHKYAGEYEDFYDRIIGSYLRKERAEEEKTKAEAKEKSLIEKSEKCSECPFVWDYDSSITNIDDFHNFYAEHPNYCNEMVLRDGFDGIYCDNFYSHYEEEHFEIEEVEVEE